MTISHVADIGTGGNKSTTSGTPIVVTLTGAASIGDVVVVVVGQTNLIYETVTDSKGNTWLPVPDQRISDAQGYCYFAYSVLTTAVAVNDTISVHSTSTGDKKGITVMRFTFSLGVNTTEGQGPGLSFTSSTTPSIGPWTPTDAAELILGGIWITNGPTSDGYTEDTDNNGGDTWHAAPAGGTSSGSQSSNGTVRCSYKITTSAAAQTFNPTLGTARSGCIGLAGLRETAAVSTPSLVTLGMSRPKHMIRAGF